MRCAIYARLSKKTAENELNLTDQIQRCRERAAERGWEVVAEFSDRAESAYDRENIDDRPGFGQLLELVRIGAVDVVLAWRPDRLFRDPIEAAVFLRTAAKAKVTSVSTVEEGDRDPSNPGDEMIASI